MEAYVKSFSTYRTTKKATVISSALTVDSLDADTSTVTVVGTDISRADAGNWLIIDNGVYLISAVKPQTDRTMLTLKSPLDAFARKFELAEQPTGQKIGTFIKAVLDAEFVGAADPVYSLSYLAVTSTDTTAFIPPELDNNGLYSFVDYVRLMRKTYRVTPVFSDAGSSLLCTITHRPVSARQVIFDDGISQLSQVDYSAAGTAKITAIQDVDTGEKNSDGEAILRRERTTWYLGDDGSVSQTVPARRASGKWETIFVSGSGDVEAKVKETFAKNKANHKLEFFSKLDLNVQDDCTFRVYGELLSSYISYKSKSSTDSRWFYRSGELATTAAEKLRRLN